MQLIMVDIYGPAGHIGKFGFYTLPRRGERILLPGTRTPVTVQDITHFGAALMSDLLPPPVQLTVGRPHVGGSALDLTEPEWATLPPGLEP